MINLEEIFSEEKEIENGLYVVATPIGNMGDITIRALRILDSVDFIYCEDTRRTLKLLSKYGIKKKLISCNGYNEKKVTSKLEDFLIDKKAAYVSDSGTPGISDPGELIVRKAHELGIKVIPIPGASALASIISISGFVKKEITFSGFLPVKKGKRKRFLENLADRNGVIVLYESPYRIRKLINECYEVFGNKEIVIGRELTKVFEEVIKNTLANLIEDCEILKEKGEYVVCIEL